jgi:predicted aspartyl protease
MLFCIDGAGARTRSPISLDVLQRDGYGSVELRTGGPNILYVVAEINGRKTRLLLDTGWGGDGITVGALPSDLHIAPEKGVEMILSANGTRLPMKHGIAQSVVIGNVHIQNTQVTLSQFSYHGFLGYGFLKKCGAIIDLTNLRLYLRPPKGGRPVNLTPALTSLGMAEVPFITTPNGNFVLNVEINGLPTQMALDTGSQRTVLDVRLAKMAQTKGWDRRRVYQVDAAGRLSPADFAGTKTFKIGGVPIRTPIVMLARFAGYDLTHGKLAGVLGLDVMGLNWGIIDVAQQKLYFAKAD